MKQFINTLSKHWEKAAFWGAMFLMIGILVAWAGGFGHYTPKTLAMKTVPHQTTYLNRNTAFRFREKLPPPMIKEPHPFFFVIQLRPKTDRALPWETKNQVGQVVPKRQWQDPVKVQQITETVPPVKADEPPKVEPVKTATTTTATTPKMDLPPPKPPATATLHYLGCMTTPSGRAAALIKDVSSGQTVFIEAADEFAGFKIENFTEKALTVTCPKGNEVTIAFGEQAKVVIE